MKAFAVLFATTASAIKIYGDAQAQIRPFATMLEQTGSVPHTEEVKKEIPPLSEEQNADFEHMKSDIKNMIDIDLAKGTKPDSFLIQTGKISLEDEVSGAVEPIPLTAEQIADLAEMRESI